MRIPRALLAATFLVTLTGCLTIEENYSFKKNGSGTMTYVVDMSELGKMLQAVGDMSKAVDKDAKDPDMGNMDMTGHKDALKQLPGISKVKLDTKKKWIQKLSFTFKDIAALNGALNALMPDSTGLAQEFFRWDNGTLVQTNNRHAFELGSTMAKGEGVGEEGASEGGEESGFDPATILESMKYKYSFKFQEAITNTESAEGVVKENAGTKEVKLSTNWSLISKDPKALDLRITVGK